MIFIGLFAARTPQALVNGLETGLGMATAIWMIALAARDDRRARIVAPILGGLAPFVRPELAALVIALTVLRWRDLRRDTPGHASRAIAIDAVSMLAVAAPWMLWYTIATGVPFPTTAGVKAVWFAESCTSIAQHVHLFGASLGEFLLGTGPVALGLFALVLNPVGRASLAFVVILLGSYFVQLPGGLAHNAGRYAHILIPLFAAGFAIAMDRNAARRSRQIASALLVISVLFTAAMLPRQFARFAADREHTREYHDTARFLLRALPADAHVLAHDVGYISAATPFRIIDMVGLKSPEAARAQRAVTLPSCGGSRGDVIDAIARREHATHLVALRHWDELFGISAALAAHGWTLRVMRARRDGYDVYALTPPP